MTIYSAIPDSLSTVRATAVAQLAIRTEQATKARAELHAANGERFATRNEVARLRDLAEDGDQPMSIDHAYHVVDHEDDYTAAAVDRAHAEIDRDERETTHKAARRELHIATHPPTDGQLSGPKGTAYQQNERRRGDLWGLNRKGGRS